MARAKDLISEDQWTAAIPVLRAAAADPKEPNKDEALFWLAHSQNQAGDLAEAVESIRTLQRDFPKSRWSEPGLADDRAGAQAGPVATCCGRRRPQATGAARGPARAVGRGRPIPERAGVPPPGPPPPVDNPGAAGPAGPPAASRGSPIHMPWARTCASRRSAS